MSSESLVLAARFVLPIERPPLDRGSITIRDGRIEAVSPRGERTPDIDAGNAALLPGLVNAHTHLELGPLDDEPPRGVVEDEIAWLERLVSQRRVATHAQAEANVARNLAASIAAGTTLLADITTAGRSWDAIRRSPLRAVVFSELIGLKRERALQTSREAWEWLAAVETQGETGGRVRPGLSPHAPYSTAGWLYERAATSGFPLSTHLAELPEEAQLLATRQGRLKTYLETLGAWDEQWTPLGPRPADYVRRGPLKRADWLIAHANHLDPSDFWLLRPESAPAEQRVAVVYCPRTAARFGHEPHPFRAMLERGGVVCLGTDSLASSPSLSVLDEARFLWRRQPGLSGSLLLAMATVFGAWALRAESEVGTLRPGKAADLVILDLPDRDEPDPHALVLDSDKPVRATILQGRFAE